MKNYDPKIIAESFRGMSASKMNESQIAIANRLVFDGYGLWLYRRIFATC